MVQGSRRLKLKIPLWLGVVQVKPLGGTRSAGQRFFYSRMFILNGVQEIANR